MHPSYSTHPIRLQHAPAPSAGSSVEVKSMDVIVDDLNNRVRVIVGSTKTELFAPKMPLRFHSGFFKVACDEKWDSGRTNTIFLEEEDPEAFATFVVWIYTKNIKNSEFYKEVYPHEEERLDKLCDQWIFLAKCFTLGEFLQAHEFQNAVADLIVQHQKHGCKELKSVPGTTQAAVQFLFSHTRSGSAIRKIVMDTSVTGMDPKLVDRDIFLEPTYVEYWAELAMHAIEKYQQKEIFCPPWEKDRCVYHTHPGEKHGYSCTRRHRGQM